MTFTMELDSSPREVQLKIRRLDAKLLSNYLEKRNDELSSLSLRYILLCLELEELKHYNQDRCVFSNDINLLPIRDERSQLKLGVGPKSRTAYKPMPKSVMFRQPKVDVRQQDIEDNDDTKENVENPQVKLEVFETDQTTLSKKKRGRPSSKKKKNLDEALEHLTCSYCSFIGISTQVLDDHVLEMHNLSDDVKTELEEDFSHFDYENYDFDYVENESEFVPREQRKKRKYNVQKEEKQELVKCSYCEEDVDTKRMEQHLYAKHKDVKLHICDQCPFKTNSLINLTRHIDNMHLAINTWPCPECPLQCGSPHALRKHVDRIHRNIQNYMCELCSYRTSTGSELRTHMEMKHTAVDRFKCDKCEFATALKRNLERHHIRVHSHIKPFSCPMQGCGYQATEKGDIDKHVKRVHMGMRRYQCHLPRCEFKIDSKSKWLEHLSVEHRLSQQEIEEVSLKRKRTRIGGAHRKAALLQSAPVQQQQSATFASTPDLNNAMSNSNSSS